METEGGIEEKSGLEDMQKKSCLLISSGSSEVDVPLLLFIPLVGFVHTTVFPASMHTIYDLAVLVSFC